MLKSNENNGIIPDRFSVSKRLPKHPAVDDRRRDTVFFLSGLLAVLVVFSVAFVLFQRAEKEIQYIYVPPDLAINIQQIPETRIGRDVPPPPPKKPVVPVASDIEEMLEELVWEMETLDYVDLPNLPPMPGKLGGIGKSPRPLFDSFPEFPESELKKGHHGIVEVNVFIDVKGKVQKVEVVKNTTKSKILEDSAKEAAYKTVYQPAYDNHNNPIPSVMKRTYTFGDKQH